jgi:hypothetical protein
VPDVSQCPRPREVQIDAFGDEFLLELGELFRIGRVDRVPPVGVASRPIDDPFLGNDIGKSEAGGIIGSIRDEQKSP